VFGTTRFVAVEEKPTKRPSLLMDEPAPPIAFPSVKVPVMAETSSVEAVQPAAPKHVSRRYASANIALGETRFAASDPKATKRPLKFKAG
jgi:hypothetical protein